MKRDLFISLCNFGDTGVTAHFIHARTNLDSEEGPKLQEEPVTYEEMQRVLLVVDSFRQVLIQKVHQQEIALQKEINTITETSEVKSGDNKGVDSEAC